MNSTYTFLKKYVNERPLFLSMIRAKEAALYQKYLPFSSKTLDVGCGDGVFARIVFGHIDVGLDVPDSRIQEAKKEQVYTEIVTYDGEHFPFKNNTFTSIVSNCVLEHIPDISQVIKEMYRVLKPGGKAYFTVMAKPWEESLFGSLFLGHSYAAYMRKKQVHINLFSSKQWQQAFTQHSFKIVHQEGYLSPYACRLLDLCHYVSVPNLITYLLFHRWVLFPFLNNLYPLRYISNILDVNVSSEQSGAIFFVLQKSSTKSKRAR